MDTKRAGRDWVRRAARTASATALAVFVLGASEVSAQATTGSGVTRTGPAEEEVIAVIEAVFSATEARDYAALDTLYARDATIVEGAGIDRGWASYRDQHLKPELAEFEDLTYRPRNIEPHVGETYAWALFEYDLKLTVENRRVDRGGRGMVILERRGGGWVVRHMQTATRKQK